MNSERSKALLKYVLIFTVRFPSGFSLQYNDLTSLTWGVDGSALLKKDAESGWSVSVPKDCIIEFVRPCAMYNAAKPNDEVVAQIAQLERQVKSLTNAINKMRKGIL